MNDFLQQLLSVGPGLGAGLTGNGPGMNAFMDGYQRTMALLEEQRRRRDEDKLQAENAAYMRTDRDRQFTRQQGLDQEAGIDRQRRRAMEEIQIPGALAEVGGAAEDPQSAQAMIEAAMPRLMEVFGQGAMAYGQPAVEMAQRTITGRQKKQVEAFVEQALKTAYVADNPEADPDFTQLPDHIVRIIGKPTARLSELQQFAQLPVGKPAKQTDRNPTQASIAYEAAGGDPMRALQLLNPPKPEGASSETEPLMAIMGDNGEPVYVPRSQAVGKRPASTREQGRAVTSGDAGDIAEFNTALDDVSTLRETLKGINATGTGAAVGAALPNFVTEATGWGTDAKQKNAVIARVKQVIGKALEGGVLRKEDEYKYAKILPTISDTKEVVATKLDGLEAAIKQRQQNKLDALTDAGYDVSRFTRRGAATQTAPMQPMPSHGESSGRKKAVDGERRKFGDEVRQWNEAKQQWVKINLGGQ